MPPTSANPEYDISVLVFVRKDDKGYSSYIMFDKNFQTDELTLAGIASQ